MSLRAPAPCSRSLRDGAAQSIRSEHHSAYPLRRLLAHRRQTVSVCLPAQDEAATIGPILRELLPLRQAGVVDQVVVVDDSRDGTADIARRLGAEVYAQSALRPELGPGRGKGDAMWRSLTVLRGDIICFLDADSRQFGAHYVRGLIGPLLCHPEIAFIKGFYRRPFTLGGVTMPDGGGRVTELTARPLLAQFFPELAAIRQPLAGEIAARRELLERLPFVTGYGVDIALLLDAHAAVGTAGLAQVDLDVRQNAHQPLADLGAMAQAVLSAVCSRLSRDGRLTDSVAEAAGEVIERPPSRMLSAAA